MSVGVACFSAGGSCSCQHSPVSLHPHTAAPLWPGFPHRWLWLAAQRQPWSPELHASFPDSFKRAARTLLLVAHRGASLAEADDAASSSGAAQLARLPPGVLHTVLAHAAYGLSAWQPEMPAGRVLESVRDFEPDSEHDSDSDSDPWGYY